MIETNRHIQTAPYTESAEGRAQMWIEANMQLFVPALHEFIEASRAKARANAVGPRLAIIESAYDDSLRLPEEMPVCTFWTYLSNVMPLPLGFKIVKGSVFFDNQEYLDHPNQPRRADHRYLEALDGTEVIIDHCAAQFVKRATEDIQKGARLATIVGRAGDLASTFTNAAGESHTFLIGTRPSISAKLGFVYDTKPRYES